MVAFIDQHRATYGVEPICAVLPIAPSTYSLRKAQQKDPTKQSARAQRDDERRAAIRRVWDENDQVYGPRKVWQQLRREGVRVARCTVERLMHDMGLPGVGRGRAWKITTQSAPTAARPTDPRASASRERSACIRVS
jgi:putative transposase